MSLGMFRALPPYAGGKRRLLGPIFRPLPGPAEAPVFVDPFFGGGSVSLCAKARGHRVVCNDVALRSYIIGKALIENDHVTLTHDELVRLFTPVEEIGYAENHLAPDVLPVDHARCVDRCLAHARSLEGPARWLVLLLVVKHVLRVRPMGNFGAKRVMQQAAAGDWEEMNPSFVRDLVSRGVPRHPIRLAETLRGQINAGVFANGQVNEAHQGDALEFLRGVSGDIAYFDPPYSGTTSYERALAPLDDLLRGGPAHEPPSPFSTEAPEKILPRLFEAADHIPVWVLSYGNARIDLPTLMDLVRRFRPHVEGREIRYAHCTGLASAESRQRNRELLIVGRK
jgi:DNA adenine methylase